MKICVVGFPRSGTKWVSEAFQSLGLEVGHEKWEENGGVGYMFAQNPKRDLVMGSDVVAHLVRDPRYAIGSAMRNLSRSRHLVRKYGEDWQAAWIHWNLLAEAACFDAMNSKIVTRLVKIENGRSFIQEIGIMLNLVPVDVDIELPPTDTNHRKEYEPLAWRELLPGVIKLAERYGYKPEGESDGDSKK